MNKKDRYLGFISKAAVKKPARNKLHVPIVEGNKIKTACGSANGAVNPETDLVKPNDFPYNYISVCKRCYRIVFGEKFDEK